MDGTEFYKVTVTYWDKEDDYTKKIDIVIVPTMADDDPIIDVYRTIKENRNCDIESIKIESVTYVEFNEMERDQWIDIGLAMGWLTPTNASRDIIRNEDGTEKFSDTWD
jgi:hypothetical protein